MADGVQGGGTLHHPSGKQAVAPRPLPSVRAPKPGWTPVGKARNRELIGSGRKLGSAAYPAVTLGTRLSPLCRTFPAY